VTGLEGLSLRSVEPKTVVPGSTLDVAGASFLDEPLGLSRLALSGSYAGLGFDAFLPARFVDFELMQVELTPDVLSRFGMLDERFDGTATMQVEFVPDGSQHRSLPLPLQLDVRTTLQPVLSQTPASSVIYVNDPIPVVGEGFLLGGAEGRTKAELEGCFVRDDGAPDDCEPVGPVRIEVTPAGPYDRNTGTFAFGPNVAGIQPGSFTGTVRLVNVHADSTELFSEPVSVGYEVIPTTVTNVAAGGSLGQFIDVEGGGFVGGTDVDGNPLGLTLLRLDGEYIEDDAIQGIPVTGLEVIPEFSDGLGDRVGHHQTVLGHPAQPVLLLLVGAADAQRVAAQRYTQQGGGQTQVDAGHLLADAEDGPGTGAQPAVGGGDEGQVQPDLLAEQLADQRLRTMAVAVVGQQLAVVQPPAGELAQGVLDQLQRLVVQHSAIHGTLQRRATP
jgi:hypothetical protein